MMSVRPLTPMGKPFRTGIWKIRSASSAIPESRAVPPVITIPAVSRSSQPAFTNSLLTSEKISSMRGSMISPRICRDTFRASRPPTLGTSMVSLWGIMKVLAQPNLIFIFSASVTGVRSPMEMSLVR